MLRQERKNIFNFDTPGACIIPGKFWESQLGPNANVSMVRKERKKNLFFYNFDTIGACFIPG